jgi:hypothetical protein
MNIPASFFGIFSFLLSLIIYASFFILFLDFLLTRKKNVFLVLLLSLIFYALCSF